MIKVAAFTGGSNVPSARYRVRQMIPELEQQGISTTEFIPALGMYPPRKKILRPFWVVGTLGERVPAIVRSFNYDLVWLQREFLSTKYTLERYTKQPRVLDVDDAIWLNSDDDFAGRLAESCELIICGNDYLANYFVQWNKNIEIIPTSVDTNKFMPTQSSEGLVLGWTGTGGNFQYLYQIESALARVLRFFSEAKLRVVSDRRPTFTSLPDAQIEFIQWSPENEVKTIQGMSIGLMPLGNSEWERGKCSYKMLLYMACGIPVVVSPIGMNSEVLERGQCGFAADDERGWIEGLTILLEDAKLRSQMGNTGRQVVLEHYSLEGLAPVLSACFKRTARGG